MATIKHAYKVADEYSDLSEIHAEIFDILDSIKDYVVDQIDIEDTINDKYGSIDIGWYTYNAYDIARDNDIDNEIIDDIVNDEIEYYRDPRSIFGSSDYIGASGDIDVCDYTYNVTHIIQIIDDSGHVHNVTDPDVLDSMKDIDNDPIVFTVDDGTMWTYDGETIAEYVPEPETWTLNLILIRDHVPTIYTAKFATRNAICQLYIKWVENGGSSVDMDDHNLTLIGVIE